MGTTERPQDILQEMLNDVRREAIAHGKHRTVMHQLVYLKRARRPEDLAGYHGGTASPSIYIKPELPRQAFIQTFAHDEELLANPAGALQRLVVNIGLFIFGQVEVALIELFEEFEDNWFGASDLPLEWKDVMAAYRTLSQIAPPPYNLVINEDQWANLALAAGSRPGTPIQRDDINSMCYKTSVADIDIYVPRKMSYAPNPFSAPETTAGAMFNPDAIFLALGDLDFQLEREDEYRRTRVIATLPYGAGLKYRQFGVRLVSDGAW